MSCDRLGSGSEYCLPRASLSARNVSDFSRMPREVPPTSSMTPLRASAWRCSSAALADLKPSSLAISARVGGAPVRSIALCTRSRICCWRAVSFGDSTSMASPSARRLASRGRLSGCSYRSVFLSKVAKNAKPHAACRDSRHGRDDRRHRLRQHRHHRLSGRRAGRRRPDRRRAGARRTPARVRIRGRHRQQGHGRRHLAAPGRSAWRTTSRGPRWPASSSPTAPTRSRRPPTSCTACSRRPSPWC